jgi:lysophospholipase L1-like esterase
MGREKRSKFANDAKSTADIASSLAQMTNKQREKQSLLLAKFYQKLMKKQNVKIECLGDSMTYGHDLNSSDKRVADSTLTDNGVIHVNTRASKTYPEALQEYLRDIYKNTSTVVNKGYSGDTVETGLEHWTNNTSADVAIIMFGINDSLTFANTDRYVVGLRKLVDRYLNWGTPVILLTAPRVKNQEDQLQVSSTRYTEPFRHATYLVGDEYGCPVIDSELFMSGCDDTYYSDTTHYNGKGYTYFASRLISVFIGYGQKNKVTLQSGSTLSVRSTRDNFVNNGANLTSSVGSSGPEEFANGEGLLATIPAGASITYGLETLEDNLILIPAFNLAAGGACQISLDFGNEQGSPALLGAVNQSGVPGTKPASTINPTATVSASDSSALNNGTININTPTQFLWITNKGWHNITIKNTGTANLNLNGFVVMSFKDFIFQGNNSSAPTYTTTDFTPAVSGLNVAGVNTYTGSTTGKVRNVTSQKIVTFSIYVNATIDNTIDGDVYIDLPASIPTAIANCACSVAAYAGASGGVLSAYIINTTRRILFTKTDPSTGTRTNLIGTDLRGKNFIINISGSYLY